MLSRVASLSINYGPALISIAAEGVKVLKNHWKANHCPVCGERIDEDNQDVSNAKVQLPKCKHFYHFQCLNHLLRLQDICAICEHDI